MISDRKTKFLVLVAQRYLFIVNQHLSLVRDSVNSRSQTFTPKSLHAEQC